uniref:Reverse transcriptase zinc-binding domain-containing protein n=1 Tax=Lactuca sativa TaxID=4236 RepID=A0A9R1V5H1_LACSA|nr:hypothetical protein LSAT_V11C600328150 [Lactuca sativa]
MTIVTLSSKIKKIQASNLRGSPNDNIVASKNIPGVWNNIVRCKNELRKVNILVHDVIRTSLTGDTWESDFCKENYYVAMIRTRIDRSPHLIFDGEFPWFKWVPLKVLCFAWRARLGRIPTLLALSRRNVKVDSQWCSACISRFETSDHLLVDCPFVDHVWRSLAMCCGIGKIIANSVRGIIDEGVRLKMGSNCNKRDLFSILYGALWAIWRARNNRIFEAVLLIRLRLSIRLCL